MAEVTYRVDTQRINWFQYSWTIHETFHMPTGTHSSIVTSGRALTEGQARRMSKAVIKRRKRAMTKPIEVWA